MTDSIRHPAHPSTNRGGFTLIEVMIAIVILAIGVMALLGSSAMVTRMIGSGKHSTEAVEVATRRLENLRRIAYSTATPCTDVNFVSGTATAPNYTEAWVVSGTGPLRVLADTVTYRTTRGSAVLGLETRIVCR